MADAAGFLEGRAPPFVAQQEGPVHLAGAARDFPSIALAREYVTVAFPPLAPGSACNANRYVWALLPAHPGGSLAPRVRNFTLMSSG